MPQDASRLPLRAVSSPVFGPLLVAAIVFALGPLTLHHSGSRTVSAESARSIYLRDCAWCHGADAHGTSRGPTLEGQGPAGVDFMLTTGRMPLTQGRNDVERHPPAYDDATIAALVDYVSMLVPGGPPIPSVNPAAADLAGGGESYRDQCAACHQAALQGGALVRGESPPLDQSTAVQIAEAMRVGPGTMPVFGTAAASDEDVNNIARYVLELQHPEDPGGQPLWHLGPLPEGGVALVALGVLVFALRRIGTRT